MDKINPVYAQYTDDSLLMSLNKKSNAKPKTHKKSNERGLKSIENEIMTAYKHEVKRVKNLPKCKIPSIEAFTRKHLKGIKLRKRNKKAKKEEAPVVVEEPATKPVTEPATEPVPTESPPAPVPEVEEVVESTEKESNESTPAPTIAETLSSMNPFGSSEKQKTAGGKNSRKKKSQNKKSRKSRRKQK